MMLYAGFAGVLVHITNTPTKDMKSSVAQMSPATCSSYGKNGAIQAEILDELLMMDSGSGSIARSYKLSIQCSPTLQSIHYQSTYQLRMDIRAGHSSEKSR